MSTKYGRVQAVPTKHGHMQTTPTKYLPNIGMCRLRLPNMGTCRLHLPKMGTILPRGLWLVGDVSSLAGVSAKRMTPLPSDLEGWSTSNPFAAHTCQIQAEARVEGSKKNQVPHHKTKSNPQVESRKQHVHM